ncbi:tRNA pseudouridine synthase B [Sinobaca qinghaiensis]|uniref:tRNA pseudouridine synthase B n=1 Tax=Sinobaca qinghaiensis TaxID=342944 RepID=A0A419V5S3_9BACL|nr:tRNA pseudouridine synthase B [Sinobaca qinghaiensis]
MSIEGIIPVWKPAGITSHDCVYKIRKIAGTKKVGHTGTLDPAVEGILPICIERATKISDYMMDLPKSYRCVVALGSSTTTEDAEGELVDTLDPGSVSKKDIENTLQQFTGELVQVPPMYSAVKVNGRKLYEYAREGKEVERPSKKITIYSITLNEDSLSYSGGEFTFECDIVCSKGTYIRTLAVDIGKALSVPAHMKSLIRTGSGPFREKDSWTLEQLAQLQAENRLGTAVIPIAGALAHIERREAAEEETALIKNGAVLPYEEGMPSPFIFMAGQTPLAVYEKHPTKPDKIKPKTMLHIEARS